jgi:hypothetical protein
MFNKDITREEAMQLLEPDFNAGKLYWKKRRGGAAVAGGEAGSLIPSGYIKVKLKDKSYPVHRIMWLLAYGVHPDRFVDHINGDKTDNRLCNLRLVTKAENAKNRLPIKNSATGLNGVVWAKDRGKWRAFIRWDNKLEHLGTYEDFFEAICARKSAEARYAYAS